MNEESNKKTRRFLVIYCIAIFIFAVSLILIASLSQARINREAAEIQEKLANAEILAADKNTRLDAAMTENQRLTTRNKALEDSNASLTEKNAELENTTNAYKKFSEILNFARLRKNTSLKNAISAFEEAGYSAYLTPEYLEIYNSIK